MQAPPRPPNSHQLGPPMGSLNHSMSKMSVGEGGPRMPTFPGQQQNINKSSASSMNGLPRPPSMTNSVIPQRPTVQQPINSLPARPPGLMHQNMMSGVRPTGPPQSAIARHPVLPPQQPPTSINPGYGNNQQLPVGVPSRPNQVQSPSNNIPPTNNQPKFAPQSMIASSRPLGGMPTATDGPYPPAAPQGNNIIGQMAHTPGSVGVVPSQAPFAQGPTGGPLAARPPVPVGPPRPSPMSNGIMHPPNVGGLASVVNRQPTAQGSAEQMTGGAPVAHPTSHGPSTQHMTGSAHTGPPTPYGHPQQMAGSARSGPPTPHGHPQQMAGSAQTGPPTPHGHSQQITGSAHMGPPLTGPPSLTSGVGAGAPSLPVSSSSSIHSRYPQMAPTLPPQGGQQRQQEGTATQQQGYMQQPMGYPPTQNNMGMGQGGYPNQGGSQMYPHHQQQQQQHMSSRRLDPDMMPGPVTVLAEDEELRGNGRVFNTHERGLAPPLVTTNFIVRDTGLASPRFIRSTMYKVPITSDLVKQLNFPIAVVITPFASLRKGPEPPIEGEGKDCEDDREYEMDPPLVNCEEFGPVRCIRCKAYMSPFMQFVDGGRKFYCPFCSASTETPPHYFAHLDHTGFRMDRLNRAELCLGSYEMSTTTEYCRDSVWPAPPALIFALDISYGMLKCGAVDVFCKHFNRLLDELAQDPEKSGCKIGLMTYSNCINFYNLSDSNGGSSAPDSTIQQLTVGDVEDVFVPVDPSTFLTPISKCRAKISEVLEYILSSNGLDSQQQKEHESTTNSTILGPVIKAAKIALQDSNTVGKVMLFHHALPSLPAPGQLENRESERKLLGTDKEVNGLKPQSKYYNDLGQECVSVGCGVDLFLFNSTYIDVATLSQVCRLTGGQVYKYTYFQPITDAERFISDLSHNLMRTTAYDAIMRIRASKGVRPCEFYGSMFMANTTEIEMATVNEDSTIACEIKHDDKLSDEDPVFIQAVVLFTSSSGQRKLRIHNLALGVTAKMADIFKSVELDTLMNFRLKECVSALCEYSPKAVREETVENCISILACYRKHCSNGPTAVGQMILPESMKLLPIYVNALVKSDAIRGGPDLGLDERAYIMSMASSMTVEMSQVFIYPRIIALHHINLDDQNSDHHGLQPPATSRCMFEKIESNGVYLMENGIHMFMFIGSAVDPIWLKSVFGVNTIQQLQPNTTHPSPPPLSNPLSAKLRALIQKIRAARNNRFMRLVVVVQGDKLNVLFKHYLVEDREAGSLVQNDQIANFSYTEFLCHMHKEIKAALS